MGSVGMFVGIENALKFDHEWLKESKSIFPFFL
jgi:hypothetical protein